MNPLKPFKITLAILFICFIGFNACNEEIIKTNLNTDTSYYPMEVGNYIVYRLDSTVYDDFNDTSFSKSFFARELVESTFIDAKGDEVYRIERSYKIKESDNWGDAGFDIWFSNYEGLNAEKVEENLRYIKLAFPLRLGKEWRGNARINTDPIDDGSIDSTIESPVEFLEGWVYKITALHEPMTLNGLDFDSTATVIQHEFGTATDTLGAIEIFAKDVGLIHKEFWKLETQCSDCHPDSTVCKQLCFNSPWDGENAKSELGIIMKLSILEYGKL